MKPTAIGLSYLEGKQLALLLNTDAKLVYGDEYESVAVQNFTALHWLPINSQAPMSSMFTYERHLYYKKQVEAGYYDLEVDPVETLEWTALSDKVE